MLNTIFIFYQRIALPDLLTVINLFFGKIAFYCDLKHSGKNILDLSVFNIFLELMTSVKEKVML